eukprot:gene26973-34988_t
MSLLVQILDSLDWTLDLSTEEEGDELGIQYEGGTVEEVYKPGIQYEGGTVEEVYTPGVQYEGGSIEDLLAGDDDFDYDAYEEEEDVAEGGPTEEAQACSGEGQGKVDTNKVLPPSSKPVPAAYYEDTTRNTKPSPYKHSSAPAFTSNTQASGKTNGLQGGNKQPGSNPTRGPLGTGLKGAMGMAVQGPMGAVQGPVGIREGSAAAGTASSLKKAPYKVGVEARGPTTMSGVMLKPGLGAQGGCPPGHSTTHKRPHIIKCPIKPNGHITALCHNSRISRNLLASRSPSHHLA